VNKIKNMKIKFLVITAVLTIAILCSASFVSAQTTDNSALIAQLQAEIQSLMQQIQQLQSQQRTTQTWCYTFNNNMGVGSVVNNDTVNLNTALQTSGFTPLHSDMYSENMAAEVVQFQAKYGITPQSGYVGPLTRAKLNSLYGCGTNPIPTPTPTPTPTIQPSITVTSPLAGATLVPGQTYPITWTSNGIDPTAQVNIMLVPNGVYPHAGPSDYTIASTSNSGNYNWTVTKGEWIVPWNSTPMSYSFEIYYYLPNGTYISSTAITPVNIVAAPCNSNSDCDPIQMCSNKICVQNPNVTSAG
jgi:hypothetical protein